MGRHARFRYTNVRFAPLMAAIAMMSLVFGPVLSLEARQAPSETQADIPKETETERLTRQVLELTNKERTSRGLTALKREKNLAEAAAWMAADMGKQKYFDHTDSKKRGLTERLTDFGYTDYQEIAENIAAGQKTAADVVGGWMKSEGHRRNILNPELREIGVGYFASPKSKFKRYWVQDFGKHFDHE